MAMVLRAVLTEWAFVSAPMVEMLTGASRAAVQRNLVLMEAQGLIRELTGQGRYRMWRAVQKRPPRSEWPSGQPHCYSGRSPSANRFGNRRSRSSRGNASRTGVFGEADDR